MAGTAALMGTAFALGSVVLHLVGICTAHWVTLTSALGLEVRRGLWQVCVEGTCHDIGQDTEEWLQTCRAFAIMAGLVSITCFLLGAAITRRTQILWDDNLPAGGAGLAFLAALCMGVVLLVFDVWGTRSAESAIGARRGYSFYLLVPAVCLALLSAFCFLVLRRRSYYTSIS